MKSKMMMAALLAAALSAVSANACLLQIRVACPNDKPAEGVEVCVAGVGCATTDPLGIASIIVPQFDTYTICVTEATLPQGATLGANCLKFKVVDDAPPVINFVIGGDFCSVPPPQGDCWMTGGGTI